MISLWYARSFRIEFRRHRRSLPGEPQRATGRWLRWLRLGTTLATAGAACGALALGAVPGNQARLILPSPAAPIVYPGGSG